MPTSYVQYIHYDHIMYMLYTYMHMLQSHIYTHTYICIHVCIHIHMHIHIHIHIKTHIHMHIHIHIRLKHVCAHTNVYIYIHTYINTYAYTHTRVLQKKNSHPVTVIAKKLACPISPNSMLLHRFAWIGKYSHFRSDAGMHWATTLIKGARGDQV